MESTTLKLAVTGGLEQKFGGEADRFDADYTRQVQRAEEQVREGATLATDRGFYEGLQLTLKHHKRLSETIDDLIRCVTKWVENLQQEGFALRFNVEDIDNQAGQKQQLNQMLAERGISPTSPVAIRMMR